MVARPMEARPPGGRLRGGRTAFDVKSGGKTTRACGPWTQGPGRRWAVIGPQEPGVHCRPLRRHKFQIIRFAASGKAHSFHCCLLSPPNPASLGFGGGPVFTYVTGAAAPGAARIGITPQALIAAALYRPGPPGRRRCHAAEKPWRLWWMVRVEWRDAKTRRSLDDSAGFSTFFCRSGEKAVTPPRPPPSWCTRCSVPPAAWEIPTKSGISWGPLEMISHARGK